METTLLLSKPHSLSSLHPNRSPSPSPSPNPYKTTSFPFPRSHKTLTIKSAINRPKKEETISSVKGHLENCYLLAAINYKGFTVKQFQLLRSSLPESTTLLVAKNTLVEKAIADTQWAPLKPCMKGMNAWLFVHTEEIPLALQPYRKFQKSMKLEENDFTGACFEGKFYGPDDFKVLESMPSRAELYGKLLGSLKTPAVALVSALKAPSRDLLLVLKAYINKLEDEEKQWF